MHWLTQPVAKLLTLLVQHLDRQSPTVVIQGTTWLATALACVKLMECGLGMSLPAWVSQTWLYINYAACNLKMTSCAIFFKPDITPFIHYQLYNVFRTPRYSVNDHLITNDCIHFNWCLHHQLGVSELKQHWFQNHHLHLCSCSGAAAGTHMDPTLSGFQKEQDFCERCPHPHNHSNISIMQLIVNICSNDQKQYVGIKCR